MDNYEILTNVEEKDLDKVRAVAKLSEEIELLQLRIKKLKKIQRKNDDLNEEIWRTMAGKYLPIHDMEDSHVKNSVNYLIKNGRSIPERLEGEYEKRFNLALPEPTYNDDYDNDEFFT